MTMECVVPFENSSKVKTVVVAVAELRYWLARLFPVVGRIVSAPSSLSQLSQNQGQPPSHGLRHRRRPNFRVDRRGEIQQMIGPTKPGRLQSPHAR